MISMTPVSDTVKVARHVTWVGFWINAALAALKIGAGILGRSGALVADGVHSLSDFVTDIIVIVFVGMSRRKADARYQYGHGKYETFAVMLISMALAAVAVMLFADSAGKTWRACHGEILPRPGMIALVIAAVSIISKEWLFHYTRRAGERIHSTAVIANAWHHRSDSLSSVATLAGIGGAIFLGEHWRMLDPIAAMLVSVFIAVVSFRIGMPAVKELLEISLPGPMVDDMWKIISSTEGVRAFHHFRSRRNGNRMIVDFHIKVDPGITVVAGHHIASEVERRLRAVYGDDMMVNIHVEPYRDEPVSNVGHCKD